jgi:tetratricopeptide (TPR) repeat protein
MGLRTRIVSSDLNLEAVSRCQAARELEDAGRYEEAREGLGEFWQGVGDPPDLQGLNDHARAELLLRCGVLTGFIGSSRKLGKAQGKAKDLISQSISIFETLGLKSRILEAQINLGRCYQREGAFDEARILISDAVSATADEETELKARGTLMLALTEKEASRLHDAMRLHTHAESVFEKCPNATLKGSYHNEFAIVLRRLATAERRGDYFDLALEQYAMASMYFEKAGHLHYSVAVENNVGFLMLSLDRYSDAHEHINRARGLAERLQDKNLVGQVDDSRARIFLAQGRLTEAEKAASLSARTLEKGDEYVFLAESLRTHGTILARLGEYEKSEQAFRRAIGVSNFVEDAESAGRSWLTMLEELCEYLPFKQKSEAFRDASRLLGESQDPTVGRRLLACANRLINTQVDMKPDSKQTIPVPASTEEWETFSLKDAVTDYEKMIIQRAMTDAGGVVKRAARYLKIDHQLLFSKLKNKHRDLKHLKAASPASGRRSIMLVKSQSKNVSLMPDTFQVCLPPGQTYGYIEVASDKLASKGVQRGDLLVWAKSETQENDLVAVRVSVKAQRTPAKYEYGHLIYESPKRIKLKTDEGGSRSFDVSQVSIEGRVLGYCKAADVEMCRQSFNSGGGCLSLEVHPLDFK